MEKHEFSLDIDTINPQADTSHLQEFWKRYVENGYKLWGLNIINGKVLPPASTESQNK